MCEAPTEEEAAAIVRLLIDAGADVNARGFDGIRALHEAVRKGLTETVKALLEAGAKVSHRDSMSETALDIAEEEENEEILEMLKKAIPKGKKIKSGGEVMMDAILKSKRMLQQMSQQFQGEATPPGPEKGHKKND